MADHYRLPTFGGFLTECIEKSDFKSSADFAKAVGTSPGFVSDVRKGLRHPPTNMTHKWARELKLGGTTLHKFTALAVLSRTPRAMIEVFTEYMRTAASAGREHDEWLRLYVQYEKWGIS